MPLTDENIQALSYKYAWPKVRPQFDPAEWALDGGGRELIFQKIRRDEPFLIIEIGVFLGSSVKQWLAVSPNVYVIGIDPWGVEGDGWVESARRNGRESLAEQFSRESGLYMTFLSSMWGFKERLFPVRGKSPEKLYELAELNIKPDLIFFDSDKTGVDIEVAHQLFPDAILTGDDWTWDEEQGYPIRAPVRAFSAKHDYRVVCNLATWVLVPRPLNLTEKINNMKQAYRDFRRALRRLFKSVAH